MVFTKEEVQIRFWCIIVISIVLLYLVHACFAAKNGWKRQKQNKFKKRPPPILSKSELIIFVTVCIWRFNCDLKNKMTPYFWMHIEFRIFILRNIQKFYMILYYFILSCVHPTCAAREKNPHRLLYLSTILIIWSVKWSLFWIW